MTYLIDAGPTGISVTGFDNLNRGMVNIAYMTVYFDELIAHFNVNWLSPVKIRRTLVGGSKRMLVWDDLAADEKIKIYDKGIEIKSKEGERELLVDYRSGDMWAPKIDHKEALAKEIAYFNECVMQNKKPFNDGQAGLEVVKLLTASDLSLNEGGKVVKL